MTTESDKPDIDPRQVEAFEPLPGDLLMGARRSRGISTAKVAASLNLDESVVLALEENRFGDLGAPVFARGHLRKYARLVELNPDDVIRAYDAVATEQSAAVLDLDVSTTVAESVSEHSGGWLLKSLVIIAVLVVGVVLWGILQNEDGPATTLPDTGAPTGEVSAVKPPRQRPPPPVEQPSPSQAADAGPVEPAAAGEGQAPPGVTTEADVGAGAGAPDNATAAAQPAPAAPPEPAAPGVLVFVFEQDSWLEVRDADGRRLAYEMGRAGTRRTITGRGPFSVSLGFWPGVSLSYGGQDVPIPESSRQGNLARFSVPSGTVD